MGTSGAYGGSAGYTGVRDPIAEWVSGFASGGSGDSGPDGPDDAPNEDSPPTIPTPDPRAPAESGPATTTSPALAASLAALGRRLSATTGTGGGGVGGGGGGRSLGTTGGSGSPRSGTRVSAAGGGAAAAGYGYATRDAGLLAQVGLDLAELDTMSPRQVAQRIATVAPVNRDDLEGDELRRANIEFAIWAAEQTTGVTPEAVVRQWLTGYVWTVWQREVGRSLRELDTRAMDNAESQMRAALEAKMGTLTISVDRASPEEFTRVINTCLASLRYVFAQEAA